MGLVGELRDDDVPESEALVAGRATGEHPRVPTGALVTTGTLNALHADTLA